MYRYNFKKHLPLVSKLSIEQIAPGEIKINLKVKGNRINAYLYSCNPSHILYTNSIMNFNDSKTHINLNVEDIESGNFITKHLIDTYPKDTQ